MILKGNIREALTKNIESVSMLIPRGGRPQASTHTSLGFFACSKHTWLALGSPKPNFLFTSKSILHLFSD